MAKTRVIDRGFKKSVNDLYKIANGKEIAIGITGEKALQNVDKDMRLVDIAAVHEFGSLNGRIPERSFIRAGIDENQVKINSIIDRIATRVGKGQLDGGLALNQIGLAVVAMIKRRIRAGIAPELAESTKREKAKVGGTAKNTPLIRTGRLINSITSVVRDATAADSE